MLKKAIATWNIECIHEVLMSTSTIYREVPYKISFLFYFFKWNIFNLSRMQDLMESMREVML